jgi:recombination protein RecR
LKKLAALGYKSIMDSIQKLSSLFAQFPGIGSRQSRRFVYFLLKQNRSYTRELVAQIEALAKTIDECVRCHRYFTKNDRSESLLCAICIDPKRDHTLLMVVEKDADFEAIHRSGTYQGTYFILGGILPTLDKHPESKIRINELRKLIEAEGMVIKEVILACAVTPESEHTADYVRSNIEAITDTHLIVVTNLGRGLSTGTELEYSDADTLRYALLGRK